MANFLKSLSNVIVIAVTILGVIALFFKALSPIILLIALSILLILGFISLVIYWFTKIDSKLLLLEQKFKRADELKDMRADIEALKLVLSTKRKMNKKGDITSDDVLEWIKIAVAVVIGYIIIKALLSAT